MKLPKSSKPIKTIVIFCHSRAGLLRECIDSVLSAQGSAEWKKVIVFQPGFDDVELVVNECAKNFDIVLKIYPQHLSALENINQNWLSGVSTCFDFLNSDYVMVHDEDSIIAPDALIFIEQMYNRYRSERAFRGINLGSHEPWAEDLKFTYSLQRFGLHGQAGVLTRETWGRFDKGKLFSNLDQEGWDSKIEYVLKTGFMVTPNLSRLLDRGWQGTFAPKNPSDPYFLRMQNSWVGSISPISNQYSRVDLRHAWRKDCLPYLRRYSFFYWILSIRIIRTTLVRIRNIFRN